MRTAQQIIASLPPYCWAVLNTDNSLIRIKAGESGYYPLDLALTQDAKKVFIKGMTNDEIADHLNKELGVTKAQREAMELGSMFGWGSLGADPETYDEDGKMKKELLK